MHASVYLFYWNEYLFLLITKALHLKIPKERIPGEDFFPLFVCGLGFMGMYCVTLLAAGWTGIPGIENTQYYQIYLTL